MTNNEIQTLCMTLSEQVGIVADELSRCLKFWTPNLLTIDYERANEALKVVLMNGMVTGRDAGKWLAAITKYCGSAGPSPLKQNQPEQAEGCHECNYSGCIEVPHQNDYREGVWRGIYTMVVACECGMGQLRACQIQSIRQYEARYPYWQREYPARKLERQIAQIEQYPSTTDKDEITRRKGKIATLQAQLQECEL